MHTLAIVALALSGWTAVLFFINLAFYRGPRRALADAVPRVSVIIPARNEEAGILACVESVLASRGIDLECIVVDDHSTDRTAEICREADVSPHMLRTCGAPESVLEFVPGSVLEFVPGSVLEFVPGSGPEPGRLIVTTPPQLPAGWNGKQHACWWGAKQARHEVFLFLDADVRLAPDAIARMTAEMRARSAALISGVPHQQTGTLLEKMLIPLIPYLLLGFLPFPGMRWTRLPGFAAGCGQFLMVEREAYFAAGGHAAIRSTMHDGIKLPRLLRHAGHGTTMASLEHLATCRMYRSSGEVWRGLGKNATEGLASAANILPFTFILFAGQVLPALLAAYALFQRPEHTPAFARILLALALSYTPRVVCAVIYRQSWLGALLHPLDISVLLALQWTAFVAKLTGRQPVWKQRAYQAG